MHRFATAVLLALASAACGGMQSSLAPAGREAAHIALLYWWMTAAALVIWVLVIALAVYYGRSHEAAPSHRRDRWLIGVAGVAAPTVLLAALLAYGLSMVPPLVARAPAGSLLIDVSGEQWWWRIQYAQPNGALIDVANELALPVDEPVQFRLSSDNVIHSFWIPPLGGKMDMIPGRTTWLALRPTRTGLFSGACAEYCGTAHGFMRFVAHVMERDAFARWLTHQATDAAPPNGPLASRGYEVMLSTGCGACHTVRGTPARGRIGPDLTHVGSRTSLGAGTMPANAATLAAWLSSPNRIKPGAHMPAFGMLGDDDVRALAAYLSELR